MRPPRTTNPRAWLALARLSIRAAMRSSLALALCLLLLLVVLLFPLMLRGDGTLAGRVQITVGYTLGTIRFLLAAAAIACGSAALAGDLADQHVRLIATKPVHAFTLWLGRWLGLAAWLSALLLIAAGLSYALLIHTLRHDDQVDAEQWRELNEEVLVSRQVVPAVERDLDERAAQIFRARDEQQPGWREHMTLEQARTHARDAALLQRNQVAHGATRRWRFHLPPDVPEGHIAQLRYRVTTPHIGTVHIKGRWRLLDEHANELAAFPVLDARDRPAVLQLPASKPLPAVTILEYTNQTPEQRTVVFPPVYNPELLCHAGTFTANYLRATAVLWIQILFWAAIGVTAGCLFSLPVASLLAASLALLSTQGDYLAGISAEYAARAADAPARLQSVLAPLYASLHRLVRPLQTQPAIRLLTQGEMISTHALLGEAAVKLLLYSLLLALAGAWIFRRREMAGAGGAP